MTKQLTVRGFHWIDEGTALSQAHLAVGAAPEGRDPYREETTLCGKTIFGETASGADPLRVCQQCFDAARHSRHV
jgi:hypothetical protein